MAVTEQQQARLKQLPGVDKLLDRANNDPFLKQSPKSILLRAIRETLDEKREEILNQTVPSQPPALAIEDLIKRISQKTSALLRFNLQRVVNATGVVVHTNLGRSCLAKEAIDHVAAVAGSYSNLEFDLKKGRRGSRYSIVEELICEISGAEAAMVVNNNAGAVLLSLDTLARGKEVVLSRGELVEIGGSFRIPDVMAKSGAVLKEVGTTNRTHLRDYQAAIGDGTGLLLKVHTSNYSIVGFTASVSLKQLVALGHTFGLPVMEDLGSGNFIDFSKYGLLSEPTVQDSVDSGADIITFSGDKLLGGPQAGIIVGNKLILDRIKANPLTRALRIDKLTLAALEATLRLYRDESRAIDQIPTLQKLFAQIPALERKAHQLAEALRDLKDQRLSVSLLELPSKAGGGALPLLNLKSCCVGIQLEGLTPNALESRLRAGRPPIIGRIENDLYIMDSRTLLDGDTAIIAQAIGHLLAESNGGKSTWG